MVAKVAAPLEPSNMDPGFCVTIPSSASPLRTKQTAMLGCMGARLGASCMSNVEWIAQPTRTADPSKIASEPQTAPVDLDKDIFELSLSTRSKQSFST
jgi:hypothetical protein